MQQRFRSFPAPSTADSDPVVTRIAMPQWDTNASDSDVQSPLFQLKDYAHPQARSILLAPGFTIETLAGNHLRLHVPDNGPDVTWRIYQRFSASEIGFTPGDELGGHIYVYVNAAINDRPTSLAYDILDTASLQTPTFMVDCIEEVSGNFNLVIDPVFGLLQVTQNPGSFGNLRLAYLLEIQPVFMPVS